MMLEHRQHDPVAGLQIGAAPALRDQVDPLGRAADEDDLLGRGGADERGDAPARRLEGERHLGRALIDAAMDGGVGLAIGAGDGVDHRLRLLRGRGGVEIGPALGDRREVGEPVERAGGEDASIAIASPAQRANQLPRPRRRPSRTASSPIRSSASATKARVSRPLASSGGDAAAFEIEEGVAVELADRGAMRAFDVVGEDFELGLGVDRRRAGEQQALQRLLAVGLLRVARDLDPGGDRAGRLVVGDRAPDLAAGAVRDGVADDEIGVMTLPAAREQGAAGLGIGALAGRGRCAPSSRLSAPPAARVATTRLAPSPTSARSVRLTKPASPSSRRLSISRAPLAEGDAGEPVGPALADEGLDHRGLGVDVERDLGGEMVGGAGRDVDDLDEAGRRMVAAELQRPAGPAGEARRADDRWPRRRPAPIAMPPRRLRLSSSWPSTNSSRGPSRSQSIQGRVVWHDVRSAAARPARAAPKGRSSARLPRGSGRKSEQRSRRRHPPSRHSLRARAAWASSGPPERTMRPPARTWTKSGSTRSSSRW